MICWGLGAFGLGLTGVLETNTKEDMGAHAALIVLWGANLASQPNTGRHLAAAKRRGAYVVTVDVRDTEAAAQSDEMLRIRPGTDAALALGMLHVILAEGLHDREFTAAHTVGLDDLVVHLRGHDPAWAAGVTGLPAERIVGPRAPLCRHPACHDRAGWHLDAQGIQRLARRSRHRLPARPDWQCGHAGRRLRAAPRGPLARSGAQRHHRCRSAARPAGSRRIRCRMSPRRCATGGCAPCCSSAPTCCRRTPTRARWRGAWRAELVVSHDLFLNDTARRFADVVLPATSWLEEVGCKSTNTHLYLMRARSARPGGDAHRVLRAARAGRAPRPRRLLPVGRRGRRARRPHRPSRHRRRHRGRPARGGWDAALRVSHVAHPDRRFPTPSGKIELVSEQAARARAARPSGVRAAARHLLSLVLRQGRTLTQFHGFYDHGRALPTLARLDPGPLLWISLADGPRAGRGRRADPLVQRSWRDEGPGSCHRARSPRHGVDARRLDGAQPAHRRGGRPSPTMPWMCSDSLAGQAAFDARVEVARA